MKSMLQNDIPQPIGLLTTNYRCNRHEVLPNLLTLRKQQMPTDVHVEDLSRMTIIKGLSTKNVSSALFY